MGKHNGKSRPRKSIAKVGQTIANKASKGYYHPSLHQDRHTTDTEPILSVWEQNDLEGMMDMADLSNRTFAAQHGQVVVLSSSVVDSRAMWVSNKQRLDAQNRHLNELKLPRRPFWSNSYTKEQIDSQEKAAFLDWRRNLARLEERERLLLTPFEKNLDVWRQLWRVVERSHIVVQVLDARNPTFYWSDDLASYAHEVDAQKASIALLNKADLVPRCARAEWAQYFRAQNIPYIFWSAELAKPGGNGAYDTECGADCDGAEAARLTTAEAELELDILTSDQLVVKLRQLASAACTTLQGADEGTDISQPNGAAEEGVDSGDSRDTSVPRTSGESQDGSGSAGREGELDHSVLMVGMVGYPNVGKSSTINALYGSKKTAVAPTPGKTKHFQTLFVSDDVCLVDCPGLVLPRFAHSKADLVCSGVLPIDRMTDMEASVAVVCSQISRADLERFYNIRIKEPTRDVAQPGAEAADVDPHQLLTALARARGWAAASGLPDLTRSGRQVLKDYVNGKLRWHKLPGQAEGSQVAAHEGAEKLASARGESGAELASGASCLVKGSAMSVPAVDRGVVRLGAPAGTLLASKLASKEAAEGHTRGSSNGQEAGDTEVPTRSQGALDTSLGCVDALEVDLADLQLMDELGMGQKPAKQTRAAHKFQKKPRRTKGRQGRGNGVGNGYAVVPIAQTSGE